MKNELTEEDYQRAIELTSEQEKAFASLQRAVLKCKKANIFFYQCLKKLGALNGNNVSGISDDEDYRGRSATHPSCLQYKSYPIVEITDSWADDNHYIELCDE